MTSPDELLAPAIDFRLLDGEVLSRAYAETFEIPPRSLRSTLQPDDLAKLLFEIVGGAEDGYAAERMWVRVTEVTGHGYVGALANIPVEITSVALHSLVEFEAHHVIDVQHQGSAG